MVWKESIGRLVSVVVVRVLKRVLLLLLIRVLIIRLGCRVWRLVMMVFMLFDFRGSICLFSMWLLFSVMNLCSRV